MRHLLKHSITKRIQDSNESAILKIKYCNPPYLIFQHLAVKEIVNKTAINRMRNGFIKDTLASVDFGDFDKIGVKVVKIYEGVISTLIFKISLFRKIIEKLFTLKQHYKDEHNPLMQNLVELIMNSLYGIRMRKDINEFHKCKTEHWMKTEFDGNVDCKWKLPNCNYIVRTRR